MVNGKKIVLVTQARIGSSRLPNKILINLGNKKLIEHHLDRLKKVSFIDNLIVATTKEDGVELLLNLLKNKNISYYQGSTDNVLERFYKAVLSYKPDYVVRVTSDCPLIDPALISDVINYTISKDLDYCANILSEMFPDGQDIEVFKYSALIKAFKEVKLYSDKEHVTPYIKRNSTYLGGKLFSSDNYSCNSNYSEIRMTVDEQDDLLACEILIKELGENASWKEYASFIKENQNLFQNQKIVRNEGFEKSLKNDKNG